MDPFEQIAAFETEALAAIAAASDASSLENARVEFLGARRGRLKDLQAILGAVARELKPQVGKRFNEARNAVTAALEQRVAAVSRPRAIAGGIDVSLPGSPLPRGRMHPISQTIAEFKEIMGRLGFTPVVGPEIEDEFHNFEALNIPADHPARDPLDNFYLTTAATAAGGPILLRSQTSTVQIRTMRQTPPPIRVISVGRVYRPDTIDATHSCMFHQMEGLCVGEGVTMSQLKTVLRMFARAYLGGDVHVRFRPSFFPFTEPSVEVDMSMDAAGTRWLEIGGAGMVDPNVFAAVGYDPGKYTGFAFGLGVERFCMRRHGVSDIRSFTNNDLRFLRQF
jgi:phenylalanyl-tRNA synthetase alpha chain